MKKHYKSTMYYSRSWKLYRTMSEKSAILLADISSSQADTELVVRAAVSPFPIDAPEEKVVGKGD